MEILCQVAWNCVKGIQKATGEEGRCVGADSEHQSRRISIHKQDKGREGVQAEVMKWATLSQPRCSRPPPPSHTTRCLGGRSDFYTLLQRDYDSLQKVLGLPWRESPQISPSRENTDSYCFSFTFSGIFCNIPLLSFYTQQGPTAGTCSFQRH